MKLQKRRVLRVILVFVFIMGCLLAWLSFTKGGFIYLRRLEAERESHINKIQKLLHENRALKAEIERLRNDKYIESLARKELGLVRKNEIIYRFQEKRRNQN